MNTPLGDRLRRAGQELVLRGWDRLTPEQQARLTGQLESLDLDQLARLYALRDQPNVVPDEARIAPIAAAKLDGSTRKPGEEAMARGEIAVLVVAGGQGTRLGFEQPKGTLPIGPVSGKSLFQIHAEKVLALSRRHGKALPFLVMTSPATHEDTLAFFEHHRCFGLDRASVHFFCQGTMPALDLATGHLLLDGPASLFLAPNGHGGTLLALAESGLLDKLGSQGIRHIFYFQVDNPMVPVCEPALLGHHIQENAEVTTKAIYKNSPLDKLGNLVLVDGRCTIIEYSDLPERLARQVEPDGQLRFRLGSPAVHVFELDFLRRVATGDLRIPFHHARKKVPWWNAETGHIVKPTVENALKFELFIFDVLPRATRCSVVEADRAIEFHPVKNATGPDSPATARQALVDQAAAWLKQAGVWIPREADGKPAVPLEVSPLFALDAEELASKVGRETRIAQATYFG